MESLMNQSFWKHGKNWSGNMSRCSGGACVILLFIFLEMLWEHEAVNIQDQGESTKMYNWRGLFPNVSNQEVSICKIQN